MTETEPVITDAEWEAEVRRLRRLFNKTQNSPARPLLRRYVDWKERTPELYEAMRRVK